jgi:predicted nucleotidyltransferase
LNQREKWLKRPKVSSETEKVNSLIEWSCEIDLKNLWKIQEAYDELHSYSWLLTIILKLSKEFKVDSGISFNRVKLNLNKTCFFRDILKQAEIKERLSNEFTRNLKIGIFSYWISIWVFWDKSE